MVAGIAARIVAIYKRFLQTALEANAGDLAARGAEVFVVFGAHVPIGHAVPRYGAGILHGIGINGDAYGIIVYEPLGIERGGQLGLFAQQKVGEEERFVRGFVLRLIATYDVTAAVIPPSSE